MPFATGGGQCAVTDTSAVFGSVHSRGVSLRHLVPHYFVSTQPLGWRCSECSQPFPVRGMHAYTDSVPASVMALFEAHRCTGGQAHEPRSEDSENG